MSSAAKSKFRQPGASSIAADHWLDGEPMTPEEEKTAWTIFGALTAITVLAYLNMLVYTSKSWSDGLYSHGWIVPLIAGYLFWIRKRPLVRAEAREQWIAVAVIGACMCVRLVASYYDMNPVDRLSFIGVLLGICYMIGGRSMLVWAGPAVVFLIFMFPLPSFVENTLLLKLQTIATQISTWTLQLLGFGATRIANVIKIDGVEQPLTVAEACSGLRMLTIFGAMSFALFLVIERPWWDRLMILLSAVPIALVSNVIRIVVTGALYYWIPSSQDPESLIHTVIHDGAGYAMMFIGMGLLWMELTVLSHLTVPVDGEEEFTAYGAVGG